LRCAFQNSFSTDDRGGFEQKDKSAGGHPSIANGRTGLFVTFQSIAGVIERATRRVRHPGAARPVSVRTLRIGAPGFRAANHMAWVTPDPPAFDRSAQECLPAAVYSIRVCNAGGGPAAAKADAPEQVAPEAVVVEAATTAEASTRLRCKQQVT
jgi:hypothetical protein